MGQTPKLPRPVTVSDIYMAAVLAELQELNAQLSQSEPEYYVTVPGEIVRKEPEKPEPVYTPLPASFPGKEALELDGITYIETVPRTGVELTAIPGIGKATANRILTWFKA